MALLVTLLSTAHHKTSFVYSAQFQYLMLVFQLQTYFFAHLCNFLRTNRDIICALISAALDSYFVPHSAALTQSAFRVQSWGGQETEEGDRESEEAAKSQGIVSREAQRR
jgi:hypothetical protein